MRGARVLVIDDEKTSVEIVARYLAAKSHSVTGAGSAEEALVLLRAGSFDFIMMDVVLPGRTGLQALADVRSLCRAPVYMMSGQSEEDVLPDARLLGAAGYFAKPLDLPAIAAVLERLAEPSR